MAAAAGAGGAPPPFVDLLAIGGNWGKHLHADYIHDEITPNIPFHIRYDGDERRALTERDENYPNSFWSYAMTQIPDVSGSVSFQARMARKIVIKLPTNTGTFNAVPPAISPTGNSTVGIVTDAGKFITGYLGACNVITFGTCLDPAPSAVGPERNPIYFRTAPQELRIDTEQFGFNPGILRSVNIHEFTGTTVKTTWDVSGGTLDPVQMAPAGADIMAKEINRPQGYYQSKAVVLEKYRDHATIGDVVANYYGMGKTLGDTMLVASAMPRVMSGGVYRPNPYYGINVPGTWLKLTDNSEEPRPPSSIAFKTGDRLNAARAIFKNVPTILEVLARGDQPKHFQFFPGNPDPAGILMSIPGLYETLLANATERYNTLIERYEGLILPTGQYDPSCLRFSGNDAERAREERGYKVNLVGDNLTLAAAVVVRIAATLANLRNRVVEYFRVRQNEFNARFGAYPEAAIRALGNVAIAAEAKRYTDAYNQDCEILVAACPQTDAQIRVRDGYRTIVRTIVPIIAKSIPGPRLQPCEIHLSLALRAIQNSERNYESDDDWQIFTSRFPLVGGGGPPRRDDGAGGAGGPAAAPAVGTRRRRGDTEARALAREERARPAETRRRVENDARMAAEARQRGGALAEEYRFVLGEYVSYFTELFDQTTLGSFNKIQIVAGNGILHEKADIIPVTTAFIKYIRSKIDNEPIETILPAIYSLQYFLSDDWIGWVMEEALLREIAIEFQWMLDHGIIQLAPDGAQFLVLNRYVQLYNAFTAHVNHENTMMYGEDNIGFDELERGFSGAVTRILTREQQEAAEASGAGGAGETGARVGVSPPRGPPRVNPSLLLSPFGSEAAARRAAAALAGRDTAPGSSERNSRGSSVSREDSGTSGGRRTPRRKNRKSTYRLKKKPSN